MTVFIKQRDRRRLSEPDIFARQTQTCLPFDLTDEVPSCAHTCVLQFTHQNYVRTDCTATSDLNFLCTSHTRSGLTLGEGALQCIASSCTNEASNAVLLNAYLICQAVDNAVPNTASVINATIRPSVPSSAIAAPTVVSANAVPPITPTPTTPPTESGIQAGSPSSMVVSGDGMTVTMEIMMPSTTQTSTAAPTMTEVGSNFVPEQMANSSSGLDTGQVAGIASGTGIAAVFLFGILFFFLRRRRHARQDNTNWPKQISSPDTATAQDSTTFNSTSKKLAPQDKRRSFWRSSIRSDEIGIAVGGRAATPSTFGSEKEPTPRVPESARLRQADQRSPPIRSPGTARLRAPPRPPRDSVSTIFDEDFGSQGARPGQVSVGGANFAFADRTAQNGRAPSPNPFEPELRSNLSLSKASIKTDESSNIVSLTPRYDNGHFSSNFENGYNVESIDAALAAVAAYQPQQPMSRLSMDALADTSPQRNRLQKKLSPSKVLSPRRDQQFSTAYAPQISPRGSFGPSARDAARPGSRPGRDMMIRDGNSFVVTDSVSSSSQLSEFSIDWPVPPQQAGSIAGFAANRGPPPMSPLRQQSRITRPYSPSVYTQRTTIPPSSPGAYPFPPGEYTMPLSPQSRAKVTPTKPNSVGDLFFKVENIP